MSVAFVVLPVALLLVAAAVGGFVWATKRGQFDDLTTPAMRALQDDGERRPEREEVRRREDGPSD